MQQTSLLAYNQLNIELRNGTYKTILDILGRYPEGLTDRELTEIMGYKDPNKVRPRRNELVKMGLVFQVLHRKCTLSKKQAISWGKVS